MLAGMVLPFQSAAGRAFFGPAGAIIREWNGHATNRCAGVDMEEGGTGTAGAFRRKPAVSDFWSGDENKPWDA